ncbi:MAG: diguanylate cyclase [Proteobacteria bacterium]|nr:diguanylate cyclase [Pseudomonadota bacterium]
MRKREEIFVDPLTELYNRRYLEFWINNEIKRAERFSQRFSILITDIDYFKEINDGYGHLKGDNVLKYFSEFLVKSIREVDIPIRYGGDEFLIIFPFTDKESLKIILDRIYANNTKTKFADIKITFSSGIAEFPSDGYKWEDLFQYADKGLYRAKKLGRNQYAEATETEIKKIKIPSPVFVGRKVEFNFITNSIENENKINIVTGEIGIGKTRLIQEIAKFHKNNIFVRGASFSSFQNIPFYSWRQIIQTLYNDYNEIFFSSFYKLNNNYKYEIKKIVPTIAWDSNEEFRITDKYTLYNAIIDFLIDFSRNKNLFIMFDDLQWTNSETIGLIHVLANAKINNIRIFSAFRTDSTENPGAINDFLINLGRERMFNEIKLYPLSKEETGILISYIIDAYPSPDILNFIYDSSGGNPFYIEEIIQNLYKSSLLEWSNGKEWLLKTNEVTPPGSIKNIITTKFNNLNEISRDILSYISVFGRPVSMDVLSSIVKKNEGEIVDAIDKLIAYNLLEEKEKRIYFFKEGIALKVIYSFINENKKIKMHNDIVNFMESMYRNNIENHIEEIAYHAIKAENKKIIKKYILKAAEKSMGMFAYSDAIQFYKIALDVFNESEKIFSIMEKLVKIYNILGNYDEVEKLVSKYLKLKQFKDFKGKLYYFLASSAVEADRMKVARKNLTLALKYTSDSNLKNKINADIAWLYTKSRENDKGLLICYKLISKKTLKDELKGDIYNTMGAIYMNKNDYKESEKYYKRALYYRKKIKDIRGCAAILNNLALLYSSIKLYRKSVNYFQKAYRAFEDTSYIKGSIIALFDMAVPISKIKGYKASLKALNEAEEKSIILNNKSLFMSVYLTLSDIYLHLNKIDSFFKSLDVVEKYSTISKNYSFLVSVLINKFEYYKYISVDEAKNHYDRIIEMVKKHQLSNYNIDVMLIKFEMLFFTKQYDKYIQQEKIILKNVNYESDQNIIEEFYPNLILINSLKGNEKNMQKYFKLAYELIGKEDVHEKAKINYIMGLAYKLFNDKKNSLLYSRKALKVFKKLDDYHYVSIIENQINEIKKLSNK